MSNWIHINERLPKDGEWVIGWDTVERRIYRYVEGGFYVDGLCEYGYLCEIEWWTKIPEPPAVEEE